MGSFSNLHEARPLRADSESGDEWESEFDHTGNGLSSSFRLGKLKGTRTSPGSLGVDERESLDYEIENITSGCRSSSGTEQNFPLYTPDEEQSVIAKFDRHLVLFIALLYMLSFLDRSNIGNAKIAGLSRDLHLSSDQYEWLLRAFYITYITFEWMTLLYRVIPPRISEAAFGPGVPFFLSFFYKRDELALRTGLFISAAPLATSFAASLAWAITKVSQHIAITPWRMLFLLEGFPSIIIAVFAWFYIPDSPETAVYLNQRARRVARLRLRKEEDINESGSEKKGLDYSDILATLVDPKAYITAVSSPLFSSNDQNSFIIWTGTAFSIPWTGTAWLSILAQLLLTT
ncbi:MAG: hypothetical protein Q9195_003740 [Heterodermia aff. obscurata]